MLSPADKIWNRACQGGGDSPRKGDIALASLLLFHGAAMNGGVVHAIECLTPSQLHAARLGYAFFGFNDIDSLLAQVNLRCDVDIEEAEERLNQAYWSLIPDDSPLVERFHAQFQASPEHFQPVLK